MGNRLLKLNTATSFFNQVIAIICGFILPKLILKTYGSEVNGLVNSISQFLQIITFLEFGIGAVVQSAMYKPLAEKDDDTLSRIMVSAQKFFTNLATILLFYVVFLTIIYPFIAKQNFGWIYTALMIVAISISMFAQYYFGVVDSILLRADQHGYVQYTTQLVTMVINTIACVALVKAGASIHTVKLTTSIVFLFRPIFYRFYVNRKYKINRKIKYEIEPIKQKWNGVSQHVAAVVLDSTDNIVLTVFSTLSNVSIYSVYHLVIYGIKNLFMSITNGIESLIGELWAKQKLDDLKKTFGQFEWLLHNGVVFIFGCSAILIVPFVSVYTAGINDADYIQPLFGVLITMAHAVHCLRLPYSIMILAGGHYKQTQHNYIIAAIMNIVISITLVVFFGLIGVAIGTFVAMLYQTVWMAHYVSKNLIKWPFRKFLKQIAVDAISVILAVIASTWITMQSVSYVSWVIMAAKIALIWLAVMIPINLLFYRQYVAQPAYIVKEKIMKMFRKAGGGY